MDINIDATKDKVIINFKPMLVRTTRMESSLVTEDIKSKRPVRNVIYTVLDDILHEVKMGDLKQIDPKRYEETMESITEARTLNNVAKTIEESVHMKMAEIYYILA